MHEPNEPDMDLAHLAHVELLTPDLKGSLGFFCGLLGLEVTEQSEEAAYLRGYEEQYHHSLKLTRSPAAGLGHAAWRVRSPMALTRKVARLERSGAQGHWTDGDKGHGPAFRFRTPGGHAMEVFWEVDYAETPSGKHTPLRNRPQRRPATGIPARRIDHLNLMTADARKDRDFLVDVLGFRERERVDLPDGNVLASFLSVTNLSHDIALVPEPGNAVGRFHHLCLYYTSIQHLFDLADLARESGVVIEAGPGRHGIGGAPFLFLYEPGGNRIELIGDPGYMIFDPAWRTVVWSADDLDVAAAWTGAPMPPSFWEMGTPVEGGVRPGAQGPEPSASPGNLVVQQAEEMDR